MTVFVKTRSGKTGKRYLVYWRQGGRAFKEEYAGSFKTQREARTRRDLIAGELAAGRDPRILLEQLKAAPPRKVTLAEQWDAFAAGRVDVGEAAQSSYRNARVRWLPILGSDRDPHTITPADVVAGIAVMRSELKPASVGAYVSVLAMVLDYSDVEPNPVRSAKVKLPASTADEVNPPTTQEWRAIRDVAKKRSRLTLRLVECLGLRISEACELTWGDVDFVDGQIRISRRSTKTSAGQRWLPVPDELLDAISALCPQEDRQPDGRVLGLNDESVRWDLKRACIDAGVTAHSPHDLRHRRISLWVRFGIDPVTLAGWAGHAQASMSLDVYGHVVLDPREDEWRDFWLGYYERATRSPGAAPVRHEGADA